MLLEGNSLSLSINRTVFSLSFLSHPSIGWSNTNKNSFIYLSTIYNRWNNVREWKCCNQQGNIYSKGVFAARCDLKLSIKRIKRWAISVYRLRWLYSLVEKVQSIWESLSFTMFNPDLTMNIACPRHLLLTYVLFLALVSFLLPSYWWCSCWEPIQFFSFLYLFLITNCKFFLQLIAF